eukprot:5101487-Pleurochrysis_carterae.AAC.3
MAAPRIRSEVYMPSFHESIDLHLKESTSAPSLHALPSHMSPASTRKAPLRTIANLATICFSLCVDAAASVQADAHQVCWLLLAVYFAVYKSSSFHLTFDMLQRRSLALFGA